MSKVLSFFSIRYDLIPTDEMLVFDLFINSSSVKGKEKYVKLISAGGVLNKEEVEEFHKKYQHFYIAENQRSKYLNSLIKSKASDVQKTEVIKDSALEYLHNIFDTKKEFSTEVLSKNIEACREVVESMVDVLEDHNIESLRGLIGNLSFHDFYTYDHSINVSMYCIQICKCINPKATRRELMHAGLGGLLHDLGKIKIPTHILNKPEGLNDEEYQIIKNHPDYGLDLLTSGECQVSEDIDLKIISRIVHEHHENFDGTGYPNKLKGKEEIHFLARICTIADFFDAITTKRAYNQVLPIQDAMNILRKFRAIKLDPEIFDVFERQVKYVKGDYKRDFSLSNEFDPTIPYAELPVEEVKKFKKEMNFGKIKLIEKKKRKG